MSDSHPPTPAGITEFAFAIDEQLRQTGADSAERVFGAILLLGFLPVLVILAILFILKWINIILVFILLGLTALVLVGVINLIAYRARANAMKREYVQTIRPLIDQFVQDHHLDKPDFERQAAQVLPDDAPLQQFIHLEGDEADINVGVNHHAV